MLAGLSAYQLQQARNKAIGETWQQGHTAAKPVLVPSQVSYAAAAKERREKKAAAAATGTRILPQGRQVDSLQVFSDHRIANMGGPETMAGHVPVEGTSLPQAQLGVPFTQRQPEPGVPFNPLAFSVGTGSQAHSTGLPNNGLPYEWQGTLGLVGDYAGTVTDPYSGQVYAAYTDAMQEPKVLNDPPVIKLGEPSRMLEALTGTLSFPKPIPQEHYVEWADIAEGVQLPQGMVNAAVEARIAQQAAGETYMVNNETLAGYNDTNWDGYIGDTFVLRPVIDTQTLADNSQTNTIQTGRLQQPQVDAAFQLGQGLGAHMGMYWQPTIRLLAEEKPTGPGRPKRDFEANGYWSLPTVNTSGYSHRVLDAVNSRAGDPLFSLNLGAALPAAADGGMVDKSRMVVTGQALDGGATMPAFALASDGGMVDRSRMVVTGQALEGGATMPAFTLASDNNWVDKSRMVVTGQALAGGATVPALALASDGLAGDGYLYTVAGPRSGPGDVGGGHILAVSASDRDGGRVTVTGAPGAEHTRAPHSRMPFVLPDSGDWGTVHSVPTGVRDVAGGLTTPAPPMYVDASLSGGNVAAFQAQRQEVSGGGGASLPVAYAATVADAALQTAAVQPQAGVSLSAVVPSVGGGTRVEAMAQRAGQSIASGTTPAGRLPVYNAGVADAALLTRQQQHASQSAYQAQALPMSAVGQQGVENVLRALAGTGAWGGPELDPTPIRSVASGGQGSDAALQTGRGASITAGVPQDGNLAAAVDTQNRGVDSRVRTAPVTLEVQGGYLPSLPSGRDGTLAWDSLLRRLAVPAEYDMSPGALPAMSDNMVGARAASVPLRVSNNATLFATGQGLGADQNLPTYASEGGSNKDASDFGAVRQARELQMFEQNARAHPSTYGTGAEFRNVYIGPACDRVGLVSMNPETARLMASPSRLIMEAAAAEQLRRRDVANASKDATMYASRVAYESDYANSEAE